MNHSVLLIEDDAELSAMLRDYLQEDGFTVGVAGDGERGVAAALSGEWEIAALDVMLPGIDGIEVLRRIRATSELPVLMLTARGDDIDRIVGLELGADDYVSKPCTPRELAARLRAILRRSGERDSAPPVVSAGQLTLYPQTRRALWADTPVLLTAAEFNLLELLVRHAGRPVSKDFLSQQALGRPHAPYDRSIDVHLSNVRRKLGPLPDGRSRIQNVLRQGYQYIPE
ncbi:response regulator transcription factor [Rhodocyclus tenuis]|uniref:Response regulator n=2 Tax=Rhodocyclus TaxID=1064 RepID=A0A6L5JZU4_RHOTE|nr:response regulator transcription factor [Rhodocyclus gracilis]MQY52679.1 response regulator [Rhodocyclus gracilis]NJA88521.1 response regulator transcription factor [Rhodocyclus gracilis]